MVARRAHNPEVVGSSPASATKSRRIGYPMRLRCYWSYVNELVAEGAGEGGERDIRAVEIPQRARHRLHGQVVRIALA